MTLALSLGMSVGLKRTFYMMYGELFGVALVATSSVIGVAAVMIKYPLLFELLKYLGGIYLVYLGVLMWQSKGKMAMSDCPIQSNISNKQLMIQGFITAIANPKGWAFFIALLPPFIDPSKDIVWQLSFLIVTILILEFLSLVIYASGGKILRKFLENSTKIQVLNKISGTLLMLVGIWLFLS
jgi:threonine/homoserine/homoserine lactone efflux protein